MKKTILFLALSFCAVAMLLGATIKFAETKEINKPDSDVLTFDNTVTFDDTVTFESGDVANAGETESPYEVIDFVEPKKTVYSLSDIKTETATVNGKEQVTRQIVIDSTGMSMTVKNKETGKVKKYEDTKYSFNLDGEEINYQDSDFCFDAQYSEELVPGEYSVNVNLFTEDGVMITQPMTITLVDD